VKGRELIYREKGQHRQRDIMQVKLKLRPGDRGTKKLTARYRDKLVAVRYRYDRAKGKRYTTVELIVEEAPWIRRPKPGSDVFIRIGWDQKDLKNRIKQAGGDYYSNRKLWKLPYETAKNLGIAKLIVKNA
jgi:hypothetical protein